MPPSRFTDCLSLWRQNEYKLEGRMDSKQASFERLSYNWLARVLQSWDNLIWPWLLGVPSGSSGLARVVPWPSWVWLDLWRSLLADPGLWLSQPLSPWWVGRPVGDKMMGCLSNFNEVSLPSPLPSVWSHTQGTEWASRAALSLTKHIHWTYMDNNCPFSRWSKNHKSFPNSFPGTGPYS